MTDTAEFKGHTPASLRVRRGVASISALLALHDKLRQPGGEAITREDCEQIEAGNPNIPVWKLRVYGEAIRADVATMVAAHDLARSVPRITATSVKSARKGKRRAS